MSSGEDKIRAKIKELRSWRLSTLYARTQKNKAIETHLGILKAKLSKLKRELLETASASKNVVVLVREVSMSASLEIPESVSSVFHPSESPHCSQILPVHSLLLRATRSQRWQLFLERCTSVARRFRCWICLVSSKVPKMERVVDDKCCLLRLPVTCCSLCSMRSSLWLTNLLLRRNCTVSAFGSTKLPLIFCLGMSSFLSAGCRSFFTTFALSLSFLW